jgi:glycosyltransferase involved in cell wall biosynthesis
MKNIGRVPVLLFFHGWEESLVSSMGKHRLFNGFMKHIFLKADHTVVLAEKFKSQLVASGVPMKLISVIPMMVQIEECAMPLPSKALRSYSRETSFRILFVSRLIQEKGVWELIEAFKWWQAQHPDQTISLVIAGDGPELKILKRHVQTQGWENMVQIPGFVHGAEKQQIFRDADLFVFPSYYAEGFPITILEALAAGLPLIYTSSGALDEVLGCENGVRIDKDHLTGEILGQCIWELYRDPKRRQHMSKVNRRLAIDKYCTAVVCSKIIDVYRETLYFRQ